MAILIGMIISVWIIIFGVKFVKKECKNLKEELKKTKETLKKNFNKKK